MAVDAACFLVAQKLSDTSTFQIADLSDIFGCSESALRAAEMQVFMKLLINTSLRVDRLLSKALLNIDIYLHEDVRRFFHLSVVGACCHFTRLESLFLTMCVCFFRTVASTTCVHVRIKGAILTAQVWNSIEDGTPVESEISDLSNMLLTHARDPLGVRFAALAYG
jgi:hypothetical protein